MLRNSGANKLSCFEHAKVATGYGPLGTYGTLRVEVCEGKPCQAQRNGLDAKRWYLRNLRETLVQMTLGCPTLAYSNVYPVFPPYALGWTIFPPSQWSSPSPRGGRKSPPNFSKPPKKQPTPSTKSNATTFTPSPANPYPKSQVPSATSALSSPSSSP